MQTLQSIEQVEKVFQTGEYPLLVHCTDLEYYVCKYNKTLGSANLLFREYVAASFLKIWNLQIPEFALINLQPHHNPQNVFNIKNNVPCFGSLYKREYREIDAFIDKASPYQKSKFCNKNDLLKISLFDYWVSNEDRNSNNYNMMLKMENGMYYFIPIDNAAVFHTGNQDKINYTLSQEESLIFSPLIQNVFNSKSFFDKQLAQLIRENYYLCVQGCKSSLQGIINDVPLQWQINKRGEYENLLNFLFTNAWIEECLNTFLQHLQLFVNKKNNGNPNPL